MSEPAPRTRGVARIRGGLLLLALVLAAAAGAWYYQHQARWLVPAPPLDMRYEAAARKLAVPAMVSPSEEYPAPDGSTLYLTEDEFRAVNTAAALPRDAGRRLARALTERDPAERAELLSALVRDVPATRDADKEAMALYRLVDFALRAQPESAARTRAKAEIDRLIGCRFVGPRLPDCASRPSLLPLWLLAGASGASLLGWVVLLVASLRSRARERSRDRAARAT